MNYMDTTTYEFIVTNYQSTLHQFEYFKALAVLDDSVSTVATHPLNTLSISLRTLSIRSRYTLSCHTPSFLTPSISLNTLYRANAPSFTHNPTTPLIPIIPTHPLNPQHRTHPFSTPSNTPSNTPAMPLLHHIFSTHPQHIISTQSLNPPSQHTLSTHPINPHYQPTLSNHSLNPPSHPSLSTHPLNPLSQPILSGE